LSDMDRREYEDYYGVHVGYCRVHHQDVVDSCDDCDIEDKQNQEVGDDD
jgi:hypothetical protein